ncbi:MAG: thioredoxin [Chthoniobacterales bacterium]|nr:thioredoxin [Chthoniobacterales bacterium]
MSSPHVTELKDSDFESFLNGTSSPVLLDFWAPWCGPCKGLTPVIEEIASENAGKFVVAKVNVDDCPTAALQFGIKSIPTLIFFKNGEKRDQTVGVTGKADILRRLEALL